MQQLHLDAFIITDLPHVRYLCGFTGSNAVAVLTSRRLSVVTDARYRDQIKTEVRCARIAVAKRSLWETMRERRWVPAGARVGVEAEHLSVAGWRKLKSMFASSRVIPTLDVVEELCAIKDRTELGLFQKAVRITDAVFGKILSVLKPGMRELELAAEISYWHRRYGAEADAFEPIVAGGPRGAFPHAKATEQPIREGQLLTIDLGCRYAGYHSDLTRTIAIGRIGARRKKMYEVVLDAQRRAIDAVREGIRARALDAIARDTIAHAGLGKYFSHSLGHGVGLRVHEKPRVSALSDEILQAGNVVTVEPGVYIPGLGGVRIEDVVAVGATGPTVLSRSPKELMIV